MKVIALFCYFNLCLLSMIYLQGCLSDAAIVSDQELENYRKDTLTISNKADAKIELYQWRLDNNYNSNTSYFNFGGDSIIYELRLSREMGYYKVSNIFFLDNDEYLFVFEHSPFANGRLLLANYNLKSRKLKKLFVGQSPTLRKNGTMFNVEDVLFIENSKIIHIKNNVEKFKSKNGEKVHYYSINVFDYNKKLDLELERVSLSIDAFSGCFWLEEFKFDPKSNSFMFFD